ncbi:hypothetical protein [Periweissella cryptocerci]|nr:hypothetical protein [Periweissella cryptocerci]
MSIILGILILALLWVLYKVAKGFYTEVHNDFKSAQKKRLDPAKDKR